MTKKWTTGFAGARTYNRSRSKRAQTHDKKWTNSHILRSPTKANIAKWKKNPGQYDIQGIDTAPKKKKVKRKPATRPKSLAKRKTKKSKARTKSKHKTRRRSK